MKDEILAAALQCARVHGLYEMTRGQVAGAAEVSAGSVSFHFADMHGLRSAVVQHCIKREQFLDVLAEALAHRDWHALRAPAEVKRAALNTIP